MYLFTFSYNTQWANGFYQVIAETESQARELLNNSASVTTYSSNLSLENTFSICQETAESSRIVYTYEIENPNYEG